MKRKEKGRKRKEIVTKGMREKMRVGRKKIFPRQDQYNGLGPHNERLRLKLNRF